MLVLDRCQSYLLESNLDALSILGAGLQVHDLGVLLQELVDGFLFYLPLGLPVYLVAHQDEGELLGLLGRALRQELRDPGLDVVEGLDRKAGTFLFVMS